MRYARHLAAAMLLSCAILLAGCASTAASPDLTPSGAAGDALIVRADHDQLTFQPSALHITRQGAAPVTLHFDNSTATWQHNWVLLRGDREAVDLLVADGRSRGAGSQFLPADRSAIIATTRLLEPGEAETISFPVSEPAGVYIFVCTVPGHYEGGMHGTLTIMD